MEQEQLTGLPTQVLGMNRPANRRHWQFVPGLLVLSLLPVWGLACGARVAPLDDEDGGLSDKGRLPSDAGPPTPDAGADVADAGGFVPDSGYDAGCVDVGVTQKKAVLIAVGYSHACAVTTENEVYCWGEFGPSAKENSTIPVLVAKETEQVTALSAGAAYSCLLTSAGRAKCWGANQVGQLGNGTNTSSPVPVDVVGLSSGVKSIYALGGSACAIVEDGRAKCWGSNSGRLLGHGAGPDSNLPVDVTAVQGNVVTISEAGVNSTVEERFNNSTPAVCALLDTGVVQCWHGSELTEFAAEKYTKMSSGIFNTLCLVNSSGALKCLGPNPYGEVDGTGEPRNEPVSIAGIEGGIVDIAIGGQHTCAITERGVLLCWGNNANNKITPTGGVMIYPPRSPLMATMWEGLVRKAGAGYEFTCAIVGDGDVTCWGVPGPQLGLGYRWGSGIPGWYGVGCCWLVVGFGGDPPHGFCQPPSP